MPIARENRHHYGSAWRRLSFRIRNVRANCQCECTGQCGVKHHGRDRRCSECDAQQARTFRGVVVLTVAHLNRVPGDDREENLLAMCQACHNRYDGADRAKNRARRRWREMVRFMRPLWGEGDA